jgi:hypothetical protein
MQRCQRQSAAPVRMQLAFFPRAPNEMEEVRMRSVQLYVVTPDVVESLCTKLVHARTTPGTSIYDSHTPGTAL